MGTSGVTTTPLLELRLGQSPYSADLIQGNSSSPFLSISGAKKGGSHKGGGIAIPDFRSLDRILGLIGAVSSLKLPAHPKEERVAFCSEKARFISGETKLFGDQWFYRVKVYRNFFKDGETGKIIPLKEHGLRPDGFRFFIKEMDFPLSDEGIQFAATFVDKIHTVIKESLHRSFNNSEEDVVKLTREFKVLTSGDLPWVTVDGHAKVIHLSEPLLDTVCQCLLDDPYTEESLGATIHISPRLSASFTNPAVRYAPEFLAREIVVDRLRGLHGNLQYQATKIPHKALQQSPMLTDLLDENAKGEWPSWKKVTFSNDQFPQDRPGSFSYAKFEVEAFCGARAWGVSVDINQARATALRLFDLKRYFEKQKDGLDEVRALCERFTAAVLTN